MTVSRRKSDSNRNAMLAKIHVAKKQLCLDDEDYRDIVESIAPGKRSSGDLDNGQLAKLLKRFESIGFKVKNKEGRAPGAKGKTQIEALKDKAQAMLDRATEYGFVRYPRKLVFKVCNVDDIRFCNDVKKLKQLIAVISRTEPI